jgi:citrate lyase subunit beta/citryl-CoA lyase
LTCELAGSLVSLGAALVDVAAIQTIFADFHDLEGLKVWAERVKRDGFRGMMTTLPEQVPVINAAFAPADANFWDVKEFVALFAANVSVGKFG